MTVSLREIQEHVAKFTYKPGWTIHCEEMGSHKCVYCGATENLQIDHIIPIALGGTSIIENLQVLCRDCNLAKKAK